MIASIGEHYHFTPQQISEMTLYQVRILAIGHEKMGEIAREHAAKKQPEEVQAKRRSLIEFYERQGYNAR